MSNIRETTLHLLQDATGKTLDLRLEQEVAPKLLTVIELKPETTQTFLRNLTEGSVVDWGDGTKITVTAEEAKKKEIWHFYDTTSTANRVVTIDGRFDSRRRYKSFFREQSLICVRSLGDGVDEVAASFANCNNLKAVPAGLFANHTAKTLFDACFAGCSDLTAIPAGLFDHCTAVTNFASCFSHCPGLTGETPYTMVDGKKIRLWERSPENGFAKVTNHGACFRDCVMLSDYAEIPDDWK